ncbi:hypothetical protein [Geodermatophilus sp. DSM 44513]|uniref:Rv0361 family membrane protein n=1 Tax=Geodermatophilus sp. DSM 44513 TaxID=1528104 RepID=UPI001412D1CA|nr:hypothetical protein [Geodermatophilus sp. DSM 44513]WNV76014.1 hypothetical protein RTG05_01765 [Geodermatophilus sp. DSM 44513]
MGSLLVLGGCGALAVRFLDTVGSEVGPVRDAAESYAQALVDGRWDDAHAGLCADVRGEVTADELAAHHTDPDVTGYDVRGFDVRSSGGRTTAEVTVTLEYADGWRDNLVLPLADEQGTWRVCP